MNIFEQAVRGKLRFPSNKGLLTVEQLFDLPLQSKQGFDLDTVAKEINRELKAVTDESFVCTSTNPAKAQHELALEIVKHVIADRLAENELNRTRAARAAERNKLLSVLADKQDAALQDLTPEQIQARLKELDA